MAGESPYTIRAEFTGVRQRTGNTDWQYLPAWELLCVKYSKFNQKKSSVQIPEGTVVCQKDPSCFYCYQKLKKSIFKVWPFC